MQGDPNRAKRVSPKQGADADILTAPGFHRGHLCARWAGSAASSLSAGQGKWAPRIPRVALASPHHAGSVRAEGGGWGVVLD